MPREQGDREIGKASEEGDIDSVDSYIFSCGFLFLYGVTMRMSGTTRV
jgi:hypothetical protein